MSAHLQRCSSCGAWWAEVEAMARSVRVRPADQVPDLVNGIVETWEQSQYRRPWISVTARIVLAIVASWQLRMAIPRLLAGVQHANVHATHEIGAWGTAAAFGMLAAAIRPRLAAGLAPFMGALVVVLSSSIGMDVIDARVTLLGEAPHMIELAGFVMLIVVSFTADVDRSGRPTPASYGPTDDEVTTPDAAFSKRPPGSVRAVRGRAS